MPKRMLVLLAMMAGMFAVPSVASATNDTPPPGNGPPELCSVMPWLPQCDGGGSNVTVDEATEEECPAGGYAIVVDGVRYPVCNGVDGQDGEDGSDGTDGTDGSDGTKLWVKPASLEECPAGGWVIVIKKHTYNDEVQAFGEWTQYKRYPVCNGVDGTNGADGADGQDGSAGANGTTQVITRLVQPETCVSTRTAKLRIKKNRGDRVRGLTARLHGKKLTLKKRGKRTWTAKVPLAGLPQGVWAVHIKYRLNGKIKRQVHLYRTCIDYDVAQTGLNARPIVRL